MAFATPLPRIDPEISPDVHASRAEDGERVLQLLMALLREQAAH
ncbi:hypothetical protein [Microvirga vignae]|nr:hypothetical protein [Microvirga vignae]